MAQNLQWSKRDRSYEDQCCQAWFLWHQQEDWSLHCRSLCQRLQWLELQSSSHQIQRVLQDQFTF